MAGPTSPLGDPFPSKRPPTSTRRSSSAAFEASFARGLDLSNLSSSSSNSSPPIISAAAPSTAPQPSSPSSIHLAHHQSASARLLETKALEARVAEDERREELLLEERVEMHIEQHRSVGQSPTIEGAGNDERGGKRSPRFSAPAATLPPPPSRSGGGVDRDDAGLFAGASSSWNGSLGAAVVSMHGGDCAGANRERGRSGRTSSSSASSSSRGGSRLHGGGGKVVRRNAIVKRRKSGSAFASARGSGIGGGGGGGGAKFYTKKHVNAARRSGLGTMKRRSSSSS